MKVIGAGLPRSATTTQMFALETLGFGGCYHMRDLLADWRESCRSGNGRLKATPTGSGSSPGGPVRGRLACVALLPRVAEHYPDAKVVLSVRDSVGLGEQHAEHGVGCLLRRLRDAPPVRGRRPIDPLWDRYIKLMTHMTWDPDRCAARRLGDRRRPDLCDGPLACRVKAAVPADRLLVWNPREGYEPLCEFLDGRSPAGPLPRLNDTHASARESSAAPVGAR